MNVKNFADFVKYSRPSVNEQNVLNDLIYSRTKFVNQLQSGWDYSPNNLMNKNSFIPKKGDLMVSGYDNKPLVFTKNNSEYYCYLNKDGKTVMCGGNDIPDIKKFILPTDIDKFKSWNATIS